MEENKNDKNNQNQEAELNEKRKKRSFLDTCVNLLFGAKNKSAATASAKDKLDINYKDSEGLTIKQMEFSLWLIEHKEKFKNLFTGFLIFFSCLVWGYAIFGLFYYVLWGMKADERLAAELSAVVLNVYRPPVSELIISPVIIIPVEENRYDLLVKVKNPNQRHWAKLFYNFYSGSIIFPSDENFILPGEEKYLMNLNVSSPGLLSEAGIEFTAINWLFVNPRQIPDWEKFKNERLNIIFDKTQFIPARSNILSEKLSLNELIFTASNQTAYNFYEINFVIVLFDQAKAVGAGKYKFKNFYAGQTKNINLLWPGRIAKVDEIYIAPEINIIKDDIYVRF